MKTTTKTFVWLLGIYSTLRNYHQVDAWSLLRGGAPPRKTQSLVNHLQKGTSRLSKDVSVVSISTNECGIQFSSSSTTNNNTTGRELAYVDRSEFVTPDCGLHTNVGKAVDAYFEGHSLEEDDTEKHRDVLPSIYVAIFLSLTRENLISGGQHAPYIKTLPSVEAMQHLPVFWTSQSLEQLQSSNLRLATETRRKEWKDEHELVQNAIEEQDSTNSINFVDFDTWCWARSMITSRGFTDKMSTNGEEKSICLVPYVDMMNHISPSEAASQTDSVIKCHWNIDKVGFRLTLPEEAKINEDDDIDFQNNKRIEISYGRHSNSEFLMNYGFSINDDDHQSVDEKAMLSMALPTSFNDPINKDVEQLWEADGLGDCHKVSRNITVSIGEPGPMESLLSMCRVASTTNDVQELSAMKDRFVQQGQTTSQTEDGLVPQLGATLSRLPFSMANEIRAMELLQLIAVNGLGKYATSLGEDDWLMTHPNSNWLRRFFGSKMRYFRRRNALIVRRGEKRVILHCYNLATVALQFLRISNLDFEVYKEMLGASLENEEPMVE